MTKKELIQKIANENKSSIEETNKFYNSLITVLKKSLEQQQKIQILGFGSFCVKEKSAREGRNPKTGEIINIPAMKIISFKVSEKFKIKLNTKEKPKTKLRKTKK